MDKSKLDDVQQRFQVALDEFLEKVEEDRNILAAILFGSLSYDTVWEKSDIDLMLISNESKPTGTKDTLRFFALVENDVNLHASLQTRSDFKRMIEGSLQSSAIHSSFAKSKLLFTRDETIRELYDRNLAELGERDRRTHLFCAGTSVLPALVKAEKFCRIKRDPLYGFLWLSYTYNGLAQIETYLHQQVASREVLQQALTLNPEFFEEIYTNLLHQKKTLKRVGEALERIDGYLEEKIDVLFLPLLDYLEKAGTVRSSTEIDHWFQTHLGVHSAVTACEWLADKGVIAKASTPVRLTPKSKVEFEELAFFSLSD